jgi:nucleotide-binding universal stress UspA family protein
VKALVWVAEETWEGCVEAAAALLPAEAEITLLAVADADVVAVASGARAGLLGRARHPRTDDALASLSEESAGRLLDEAATRLGRPYERTLRRGRIEQEVIAAAHGVDVLVLARDGDRTRRGPRSLAHATRFVLDHAPCAVLLTWPEGAPEAGPPDPPAPPGRLGAPPPRPRP